MKNLVLSFLSVGLCFLLGSCGSVSNRAMGSGSQTLKDYSQYNSMVEVLQNVRGLWVKGNGSNAKVVMRGTDTVNAKDREPLYVMDGVVVGSSVRQLDLLIRPVQVKSVRTVRGTQATSRYGDRGLFGVVLITTIASDKQL